MHWLGGGKLPLKERMVDAMWAAMSQVAEKAGLRVVPADPPAGLGNPRQKILLKEAHVMVKRFYFIGFNPTYSSTITLSNSKKL